MPCLNCAEKSIANLGFPYHVERAERMARNMGGRWCVFLVSKQPTYKYMSQDYSKIHMYQVTKDEIEYITDEYPVPEELQ